MSDEKNNLLNVDDIEEISEENFFENSNIEDEDNNIENENAENENIKKDEDEEKKSKTTKKTRKNKKEKIPATDDIVTDNLVEAFALLSTMLDEAKSTKENIEKIHESILKLLEVVTQLRDVSEEFSKVNQIVNEINVLVKAISVNNSNIKELIDIIYKITEKQKKIEEDVNYMKNEIFFTEQEGDKKTGKKNTNFLQIANFILLLWMFIIIFFKLKGG